MNAPAIHQDHVRHTLLLRLTGPMQSWGVQSRFTVRDTALEPTKSGVIGLVCAALGRNRSAPIDDLAALRMGVRVDREGRKRRDYQTSGQEGFLRARGKVETRDVVPSERYYLSDAHFTVGLEGSDLPLLQDVHQALRAPQWPLALGRKAFPPGRPIYLREGLQRDKALLDALEAHPWVPGHRQTSPEALRYVIEPTGDGIKEDVLAEKAIVHRTQPDQPLSFQPRRFAQRDILVLHRPINRS